MKLLKNPEAGGPGAKAFGTIASRAAVAIPDSLPCIVFATREECDVWIRLRHAPETGGAGVVRWDAQQAARYNRTMGHADQNAAAVNLLNLAVERRWITDQQRRAVKITHLTRLVRDRDVQSAMELRFDQNRQPELMGEESRTKNIVKVIVDRLPSTPVLEIYNKKARVAFLNKHFGARAGFKMGSGSREVRPGETKTKAGKLPRRKPKGAGERRSMIPDDDPSDVTQPRCRDLYEELKGLDLNTFPNAAAVLFRVLVELSVSSYCNVRVHPVGDREKLSSLMRFVLKDLSTQKRISKGDAQPVSKALGNQHHPLNPDTLHYFVHSELAFPDGRTLRGIWDSFAPFFQRTWEVISEAKR